MYWSENGPSIKNCTITENFAIGRGITQNGINLYGGGAGFFCWSSDAVIEDAVITDNNSNGSGGGVLIGGDTGFPWLKNCLVARNSAVLDGGGIAARWYATPTITNCTIADNEVTLSNGAGGGIASSYGSDVIVRDSIVWGNTSAEGAQLAAISGSDYYQYPSTIDVKYSDIQPVPEAEVVEGPMALDIVFVIDTSASMGAPIIEVRDSIPVIIDGIAAVTENYRVALVGYRNYDAPGADPANSYLFKDFAPLTNDPAVITAGITQMVIGGGAGAESVYSALMHCIDPEAQDQLLANIGQGQFIDPASPGPQWGSAATTRKIIILMADIGPRDPEQYTNYGIDDIVTAANDNSTTIFSVRVNNRVITAANRALFGDLALRTGGQFIEALQTSEITTAILDAVSGISVTNAGLTYPYIENGSDIFGWDSTNNLWDAGNNNLDVDPNFMVGYYLGEGSLCIDAGEPNAADAGLVYPYTTQINGDGDDPDSRVDLGYHYRRRAPQFELIVQIDPGSVDGPHGTVAINPSPDPVTGKITAGTMVTVTAIPDAGYRVREWIGTDDAPAWQETSATFMIDADTTIGVVFELDVQYNLLVPEPYATIEEAVVAANPGDNIVLAPIEHYISDPDGIDFGGKNLTIMSTDPDDPAIIAQTIINCQGTRLRSKRAFHFHNGEDNRSKLWGITIKNGYAFFARGVDRGLPGAIWPGAVPPNYQQDPVTRAPNGGSASGDGYGGAILCENKSSPVFENVVFYNNMVTGAQGGDGADGWPVDDPPYNDQDDAQPGGHGGDGQGNGYGGAVACLQQSNPNIINCTFEDNTARGGMGGIGGDAGPLGAGGGGHEAPGGDGGDAVGFGQGGAIYAAGDCTPIITDCRFINNNALDGLAGAGGTMTSGNEWGEGWVASDGADGATTTYGQVRGGALYYGINSDADVTDCNFVGNMAFESYLETASGYVDTLGGAVFSDPNNTIVLKNCDFVENLPGAVYAHSRCWVDVDNCTFVDNANPGAMSPQAPAGALYMGPSPESHQIDITECEFRGNSTSADGGAVVCKTDASFTNCSFGGNTANGYGGAFYGYKNPDPNETTIFLDFQNCSFTENEAAYGGGLYIRKSDATFNNCYFMTNEAGSGGGLFLSDGTITLDGGIMRGNRAASDFALGGAMACAATAATIENFVFEDNAVAGAEAYGGGIMFYGGDELITHTIKNCLFKGNRSSYGGGAIGCNIFVKAEIDNCTFDDNDADMFGGALFCDWSSHPKINNSILTRNDRHAVYEEEIGGDSQITFSLFNDNPDGDLYDAETGVSYTGAAAINTVNANGDNIDGDPLFVSGRLGDYYLSQPEGGQSMTSPAVDYPGT
ncbi:MAG: hypothetical protein DRP66_09555, partial [Planctomycetota bacterium]